MNKSKILSVAKTASLWVLLVLLGTFFALQGIMKLAPGSPWPQMFERFGYPDGFYLAVGFLELLGGVLLLIPRVSSYASLLLGTVMIGAFGTHLLRGETIGTTVTLTLGTILFLLAYGRRPARIRERKSTRAQTI